MARLVARGCDVVDFEIVWEILAENIPVVADRVRALPALGPTGSTP